MLALLLGLTASAGFGKSQSLPEVMAKAREGRERLPAIRAHVNEQVFVDGGMPLQGRMQSWGNRTDSRQYDVAYSAGKFYFKSDSYFGAGNPDLPPSPKTSVIKDGKILSAEVALQIGQITEVRDPDPCPPTNGYYFEGKAFDAYLAELTNARTLSEGNEIRVSGEYKGVPIRFWFDPGKNWAVTRFAIGSRSETSWMMSGWQQVGEAVFSTSSRCVVEPTPVPGISRIQKDFSVTDLRPLDPKFAFDIKWQSGSRIYDRINDRVLRVKDGSLEVDAIFSKASREKFSSRAVAFIGAVFVAILLTVLYIWRRFRRAVPR